MNKSGSDRPPKCTESAIYTPRQGSVAGGYGLAYYPPAGLHELMLPLASHARAGWSFAPGNQRMRRIVNRKY